MATVPSMTSLNLSGKRVLVRVDFNVPFNKAGKITDDSRIHASLPTIRYLLDQGASVILMSHLGRPKGKRVEALSLAPCAKRLSELLEKPVVMAPDCVGEAVEERVLGLGRGELLMLENVRFHEAEELPEKDPKFAQMLAQLADFYVNDAFGTSHRRHSSTWAVARFFSGKAAAGFLLEKEIAFLGEMIANPKHPFIAILGGAKVSTKLGVIKSLLQKVDKLLIGGAMACTFWRALGYRIGSSLVEEELVGEARALIDQFGERLILPVDRVVTEEIKEGASWQVVSFDEGIDDGWMAVDIGPKTIALFAEVLAGAKMVLWNGPLGVFEVSPFSKGTDSIAKIVAGLSATTIIGGGDSIAAVHQAGVTDQITHLSTGGGASLEYLERGTLPGIEVLN